MDYPKYTEQNVTFLTIERIKIQAAGNETRYPLDLSNLTGILNSGHSLHIIAVTNGLLNIKVTASDINQHFSVVFLISDKPGFHNYILL